jgi:CRP-like cAMP-binding protein
MNNSILNPSNLSKPVLDSVRNGHGFGGYGSNMQDLGRSSVGTAFLAQNAPRNLVVGAPVDSMFQSPFVAANTPIDELYKQKTVAIYHKGKSIPLLGQDISFIQQGIVQLCSFDDEGNEILLGLASSSMPFGLPLTLVNPYRAIALSNVSIIRFTIAEIEQYIDLSRLMLRGLDMRLRQTEAIQYILCSRHTKEKLYNFLLLLCREIGEPVANGTRLKVRFTHQHLASTIGTTRVTITRILQKFQEDGMIAFDNKRHIVMDLSRQFSLN